MKEYENRWQLYLLRGYSPSSEMSSHFRLPWTALWELLRFFPPFTKGHEQQSARVQRESPGTFGEAGGQQWIPRAKFGSLTKGHWLCLMNGCESVIYWLLVRLNQLGLALVAVGIAEHLALLACCVADGQLHEG